MNSSREEEDAEVLNVFFLKGRASFRASTSTSTSAVAETISINIVSGARALNEPSRRIRKDWKDIVHRIDVVENKYRFEGESASSWWKNTSTLPPLPPPLREGKGNANWEYNTYRYISTFFFFQFFSFFCFLFFFFLFCFFFFSFSRYQNCPNLLLLRRQGRRSLEHAWKKSDLIIVDGNDESRVSA